jgi:hypothetical protein
LVHFHQYPLDAFFHQFLDPFINNDYLDPFETIENCPHKKISYFIKN